MDDLEGHVLLEAELKCRFGHLDSPPLRHIGVVLVVAVDREDEVAFALELVEILQPDEAVAAVAGHDHVLLKRRGLGLGVVQMQVRDQAIRSEEHTSELQSLMRLSYAVFCLKKKKTNKK